MIELRTMGPVEIRVDDSEPPRELLWRKNLALLLYLARSPGGQATVADVPNFATGGVTFLYDQEEVLIPYQLTD